MKILVTGSAGFVGKNLVETLNNIKLKKMPYASFDICEILLFDSHNSIQELEQYTKKCDFVINLAGVNRPMNPQEFYEGNKGFVETLCELLKKNNNKCPILASSSAQVGRDNDYAKSKKAGEDYLKEFGHENGNPIFIYRFTNLFGKWCKPNYNSVVATWCHNISHNLPIQINNENDKITLCYIDDVVNEIIQCLKGAANYNGEYYVVHPTYEVSLKDLSKCLYDFKESRENLIVSDLSDEFTKKLYSTYTSYLPENGFNYFLKTITDERGSFTEFIKSKSFGQVSVNVSYPGIVKGNHWHHTKVEKFLVVSGSGLLRFRKIGSDEIIEYIVSGNELEVIDIPVGYTHNIINTGDTDLITLMWANEIFDRSKPDTYSEII